MNIHVQDFLQTHSFISLGRILKRVSAGSYGKCVNFQMGQMVFQSGSLFYIPLSSELGFQFLHVISSTTSYCSLLFLVILVTAN